MRRYVLGLDGGGTKTLAAAQDEEGRELFRLAGGSLNPNGESPAAVRATLAQLLADAQAQAGPGLALGAVCVGAAGVSNPAARALVQEGLAQAGFDGPRLVTGDHEAALAGALGRPEGMILIAGTGSICFGRAAGRQARAGGRGHLIDDEGSGYAMGRDVLRAVVRAADGRGPATCLAQAVEEVLGVRGMDGLVGYVYAPGRPKKDIAALAKLLPEAARAEDAAALAIYDRAARELALLAHAVAVQLGAGGELALAGSALQKDERLRAGLERQLAGLCPRLVPVLPRQDAASGAALLARGMLSGQTPGKGE